MDLRWRSRSGSSASATLRVMRPLACPVMTGACPAHASAGFDRKSNARPLGSSFRVASGRPRRSSCRTAGAWRIRSCANVPGSAGFDEVGDDAVVSAGRTKRLGVIAAHQPIADIVLRIGTKPIAAPRLGERAQRVPGFFHRGDDLPCRQIPQPQPAALAGGILEIQRMSAVLARKKLHGSRPSLPAAANLRLCAERDSTPPRGRSFHSPARDIANSAPCLA